MLGPSKGIKDGLKYFFDGQVIRNLPSKIYIDNNSKVMVNSSEISLCYIGHISKERYVQELTSFFTFLQSKNIASKLIFAGPIKDNTSLESIEILKKFKNFKYYEWADDIKKIEILNHSSFGFSLHNFKTNKNRYYAEPTKVWEYLAAGNKVIMSSINDHERIYSDRQLELIFFWDKHNFDNEALLSWIMEKKDMPSKYLNFKSFEDQEGIKTLYKDQI